jgi:uncharacterized membrane protein YfcA
VIAALMAAGVLLAAFVKGAIGFGFPALGTPLLSLVVDVKTAVVVLILPNLLMDGIQFTRRGAPLATVRRFGLMLLAGAGGMVLGTRALVLLSPETAGLVLGAFVLCFVAVNATGLAPTVPARWERWLSAPAGFAAGVIGGLTNAPVTPLVLYLQAIGLGKHEFVAAVALSSIFFKAVQLAAVTWYGLLTWSLVGLSTVLIAVALGGFAVGLRVQDRLDQRTFNRAVLVFLAALGLWLLLRALR